MEAWGDSFTDAPTITAAREAIGIWLTQASSTNALTITGSGALTLSSGGAYTVTVPGTGTMVLANSTATLTNKTFDTAGTGNSFLINGLAATANTGTGSVVRATSPTLVTPVLGVATCTSINGLSITGAGGSLIFSGPSSLTIGADDVSFTTAGNTNITLPTTGTMATLTGSETLTNKVLTAATITTSLVPTTDDGAALGSTSNKFSDLFLASGAVLNFNNGNVAVTHSAGILTVGTGDLRVTTAGTNSASCVTVGGTQTLTAKTLTTPTITTPNITTPSISTGGSWGGTPNFTGGLTAEGDIQADSGGDIVVADVNGKIGYTTGAGGSVTQATSKSTSVTINKPAGKITMNGASLAATTDVSFSVDNSVCDASCNVIINVISGATTGAYQVTAHTIGIGSFGVTLRNMTAGSLSESVVLQFCIIKGAIT